MSKIGLHPMPCPVTKGFKVKAYLSLAGVTSNHNVYLASKDGSEVVIKEMGSNTPEVFENTISELFCSKLFMCFGIYSPVYELFIENNIIYLVQCYIKPSNILSISPKDSCKIIDSSVLNDVIVVSILDLIIGNTDRKSNSIGALMIEGKKTIFVIDHHRTFVRNQGGLNRYLKSKIANSNPSNKAINNSIRLIIETLSINKLDELLETVQGGYGAEIDLVIKSKITNYLFEKMNKLRLNSYINELYL